MKMNTFSKLLCRFLLGCCSSSVDQDKETGKTEMPYILLSKWLDQLDKFLSPDFNQSVSPSQQSTKGEVDQLHKGILYARGAIHSLSTSGARTAAFPKLNEGHPEDDQTQNAEKMKKIAERASDQRVPEELDEAVVVVDIIRDEFPPQFTNEPYGVSITDSQQLNVGIFSVQAFDPDLNNQGQLNFASIGLYPAQSFFDLNKTTGVVFVTRSLKEDGIGRESYTLRLIVYNSLDNRLQDTADVAITVNRNPGISSWINAPYVRTVSELYSMGTPVLTVSAFDSDQDSNLSTALELAVRFGKTLIIQEVDGVEPVLYPLLRGDLISQGPRFEVQIGEKTIDYNEEFRLFLTTRNPAPEIPPDAVITEVNFTTTKAGLTGQLLAATFQHEKPEFEEKKTSLLKQEEDLKIELAKLEESLLEELANAKGNILENKELLDSLNKTKASSITIADSLAESVRPQASLDQESNIYLPVAENGSALYFSDLAKINNVYRFSSAAFLRLFQRSLDTRQDGGGTEHRIKMLVAHLQQLVYEYVCISLFKADRLMFAMHMVHGMKPDMFEENSPPGVKRNLSRTYESWSPEYISKGGNIVRSQALFALAWFHAVVQERRMYIPQGWTKFYEFSLSDLRAGTDIIDRLCVGGVQEVQWKFIHGMFELAIYGGCVDNPFDVSVITSYLKQFFDQAILSPGRKNKHLGLLRLPTSTNFRDYLDVINDFPEFDKPSYFGLPENSERSAQRIVSGQVISQLKMLQKSDAKATKFDKEVWTNELGPILNLWKKVNQGVNLIQQKVAPPAEKSGNESPIISFILLERSIAIRLVQTVHQSLAALSKVIRGTQQLSKDVQNLASALLKQGFKVMVMDNGLPARSNEADVTIIIQRAQLPIFISTPYSTTVLETAQNNLQVFRVTATDGQGVMVYDTIGLGAAPSFFYVENDGRILTRSSLKSDRALTYTLRVIAYDSLTPNQRATADVTISVSRNVNSPEFRFDPYTQTIPEDFAEGDLILTVSAFVADNGKEKQAKRTQTFFQFCNVKEGILLCTDVAARGLDIPAVDWRVQFDPPDDTKEYIHRVGRTARGEGGRGHTLFILCPEELGFLSFLKNARVPLNEFEFSWSKMSDIQIQETDEGTIGNQQSCYADIPVYYRKGNRVSPYDPSDREQACLRYRKSGVHITELDNEPDLRETFVKDLKHTNGMTAITAGNLRKSKAHDSMTDEGKATQGQGQRPDIATLKIDIDESGYIEDERVETSDDKISIMGNFSPTSLLEKNCKYGLRSTSDLETNGEQSESDRNNVNNDMNGANMDRLEIAPNLPTSRVLLTPPSKDDISTSSSQPFTSPSAHQSTKSDVSDIHSEMAEPYALEALETDDEREKMSPLPLDRSPRRTPEKVFRKKLILKLNEITNITHGLKTNTSSTCSSPDSRSRHNSLIADIENSISGVSSPEFELLPSESTENQAEVAKTFVQLEEEIHCVGDEFETISKKIEELTSKYSTLTDDQGAHIIDTIFERYPSMRVHQTERGIHFDPMSSLSENNSHEPKYTSDAEDKSGAVNDLSWDFENLLDTVYSEWSQSATLQHPKVKGLVVSEKSEQPKISVSESPDSVFGNSTTHSSVEMDGTLFEDAFHLRLDLQGTDSGVCSDHNSASTQSNSLKSPLNSPRNCQSDENSSRYDRSSSRSSNYDNQREKQTDSFPNGEGNILNESNRYQFPSQTEILRGSGGDRFDDHGIRMLHMTDMTDVFRVENGTASDTTRQKSPVRFSMANERRDIPNNESLCLGPTDNQDADNTYYKTLSQNQLEGMTGIADPDELPLSAHSPVSNALPNITMSAKSGSHHHTETSNRIIQTYEKNLAQRTINPDALSEHILLELQCLIIQKEKQLKDIQKILKI